MKAYRENGPGRAADGLPAALRAQICDQGGRSPKNLVKGFQRFCCVFCSRELRFLHDEKRDIALRAPMAVVEDAIAAGPLTVVRKEMAYLSQLRDQKRPCTNAFRGGWAGSIVTGWPV